MHDPKRHRGPMPKAQSSPRRSEVKATKTDPEAKFKAVQVKAEKIGVENLTEDDVAGLSSAQLNYSCSDSFFPRILTCNFVAELGCPADPLA